MAEGLHRINVLNDPVNLIDPYGLKGGVLIPFRKFFKDNVSAWDIISPMIEKGLSIPTSVFGILTYDYLNPKYAGVPDEKFEIYEWERAHNSAYNDLKILPLSPIDRISSLNNNSKIETNPCGG